MTRDPRTATLAILRELLILVGLLVFAGAIGAGWAWLNLHGWLQ